MESEDTVPLLVPRKGHGSAETVQFVHSDRTVGVLGEFPELIKAVRAGDVAEISGLCAQLFELNSAARGPSSSGSGPS